MKIVSVTSLHGKLNDIKTKQYNPLRFRGIY